MGIQLSHSAKNKYLNCPMSYYMHYILKLREEKTSSALVFGTTLEAGLDSLLNGKTLDEAIKAFELAWEAPEVNGVVVDGRTTKLINFSKADSKEELADTPWECMREKGKLLITAYQKEVIPEIKDVISLQQKIEIENNHGDKIIGYSDIIMENLEGKRLLMDNKTSAKAYAKDAVTVGDKAKQLALYWEALQEEFSLDGVGFYVLEKGIRKKDPYTRVHTMIGVPTEEVIQETFDEFEHVLYNLRMGIFPSNTPDCNQFYGKCVCHKYAPSGGENTSGLICTKKEYK